MKRYLLPLLIGIMCSLSFAEDAIELPKGMLRIAQTTSFAFAISEFNLDGEKVEVPVGSGRFMGLNLGAELEMGIIDWLAVSVDWAPAWNVWSTFDYPAPDEKMTMNGGYDIFAALRLQLLGERGLIQSRRLRLVLSPGGKIPLPSPDWLEEANKAFDGEHWRAVANDYHTLGLGARGSFDLILTELIYLNLYAEFIRYFRKDYDEVNLQAYQLLPPKPQEVDYGYKLTAEAEPHIGFRLSEGMRLEACLPITFRRTPELQFDGSAVADSDTYRLAASPSLALLFSKPAMEVELSYSYPILGKGLPNDPEALAMNSLSLQVRSYLRIYR